MLIIALILTILSVHRLFSLYMTNRQWLNAPITYMSRECPPPQYSLSIEKKQTICMTTLTDSQSPSMIQRLLRWRNYDGILELTWQNKKRYADKHGYRLYDKSNLIRTSRPPAWSKILAVQSLLDDKECDWVLWADADTVFMNSNKRLEDFLPHTGDLIVGTDEGGGFNSGVFVFRSSEWSRNFLNTWWNMKSFVRPPGFSLSGDNNALKRLLADMPPDEFAEHVVVPSRCTLNSFAQFLTLKESTSILETLEEQPWYLSTDFYHKGDLVAHTAGYDNKAECIRLLLQEAV
jgi:hypothetical protein